MKKKYIVFSLLFILFIAVYYLGKINIINTAALSPLGTSKQNYEMVNEEFGEDFSKFIMDDAYIKIYKEDKLFLFRVGDREFKIKNKDEVIQEFKEIF